MNEFVEVTEGLLRRAKTPNSGYTKPQLAILGIGWPPIRGWKKEAIGRMITKEDAQKLLELAK